MDHWPTWSTGGPGPVRPATSVLRERIDRALRDESVSCYLWAAEDQRGEPNHAELEKLALDESVRRITYAVLRAIDAALFTIPIGKPDTDPAWSWSEEEGGR